ncbi:hypothetical protein Tco_1131126 [Tanacetum coccineum]
MMRAASLPTHHQLPLHTPSTSRRVDILEADIPPRKRLLLTTHIPRRIMAAIEVVNLRVSNQFDVHRRESEEFYTRHWDA